MEAKKDPTFQELFFQHDDLLVDKWHHYLEIYEHHFAGLRAEARRTGVPVNFLEIGIWQGGSLQMWQKYFGPEYVRLFAIDIDPNCKRMEQEMRNVKVFIGDQSSKQFLRSMLKQIPRLDVVIDDGGHTMKQQITTFNVLYPAVNPNGGIYLCEDCHTSYWANYGGGFRHPRSMIEYMKAQIDFLNAHHSKDPALAVDQVRTNQTHSMTFYDSVVVLIKCPLKGKPPKSRQGKRMLPKN